MRVTNKMLSNSFLRDINSNMQNMQTLQSQLSSGKEIRKPSDNPFKVARAMQLHTSIDANTQYNENISDTISWLDTTDTSLGQAGNVLQRVRELLISAGNAGYSDDERKAIKSEINQKIGEFAQTLNTNFDGKYLFGGSRGTTKPLQVLTQNPSSVSSITNSNALGGATTLSGVFSGNTDISQYVVKLTATDVSGNATAVQYSTDGGTTFNGTDINAVPAGSGTFDISNGLKINIAGSISNTANIDTYTFTAKAATPSNSKLVYYSNNDLSPELNVPSPPDKTVADFNKISSKMKIEISQGVTIDYNVSANDLINFTNEKGEKCDLRELFNAITSHLDGNSYATSSTDPNTVTKYTDTSADTPNAALIGKDLQGITDVINNLLKVRSDVGAKSNRMESAQSANEQENYNLTDILSHTEDIDITQKTMEYANAQTVYTAALQTSAKIIQPTLMDYLR